MNVLIVEDDPTSMKLVHLVLETEGFHVDNADDPEKALAMVKEKKPDIILMDLALPSIDGLALTRLLKGSPETCDIPVIAVTSYPDRFPRQQALEAGCDLYVTKPIDTRTLPKLVKAMGRERDHPGKHP
ncbi:MAG TPA: response regulator [Bacteroidota bacterium]|jgi:CheY-like chemotaxis protein